MKDKVENKVDVVGYLRENNLELKNTANGRAIQGSVTIAFDNLNSIRVKVFAAEKSQNEKGTINKAFTSLLNLLPEKTTSIKDQLEKTPTATFDTVKDLATKIKAYAEFREYAVKDDNGVVSSRAEIALRNWFDSIHVFNPNAVFEPGANFTVDAFIETIKPEMKKVGDGDFEETGRYLITALTPDFRGVMQRISYVTEAGDVSVHIRDYWRERESIQQMTGKVSNIMKVEQKVEDTQFFGQKPTSSVVTSFVEERLIRGGSATTIDANDSAYAKAGFTDEDVKKGLIARDEVIQKNTENRQTKGSKTTNAQPQQPVKDFNFTNTPAPNTGFNPKGF